MTARPAASSPPEPAGRRATVPPSSGRFFCPRRHPHHGNAPIGRAALLAREGERLTAYKDSVGVWTISVGITSASGLIKVTPGLTITKAQSDALFAKGVAQYAGPVSAAVKVPLTDHQCDALVSLYFNIGAPSFAKSTVVRRLNAGDYAGVAEAILMWNKPA